MKRRTVIFWLVLSAFILLACWWILYFPYNRKGLYRSIPEDASVILEMPCLYQNWQDLSADSFFNGVLKQVPVDAEAFAGETDRETLEGAFRALASRNTLFAKTRSIGGSGRPALVFATWVGGKGQFVKWILPRVLKGRAEYRKLYYGIRVWDMYMPGDGNRHVSFAVVEGILLGSVSQSVYSAEHLVKRVMYGYPIAPRLKERLDEETQGQSSGGWIGFQDAKLFGDQSMSYDLKRGADGGIRAQCRWDNDNPFRMLKGAQGYGGQCREALRLLGDLPGIAVFCPYTYFELLIGDADRKGRLMTLRSIMRENASLQSPVFLCLCREEYGGRLRGFKVSSLLLGMKIRNPEDISETVTQALDTLNTKHKLNLIAAEDMVNGHKVFVLDRVVGPFFEGMGRNEKPAMCVIGDWLIGASNFGVLSAMIEMEPGSLIVDAIDFDKSLFSCWIDMAELEKALVNTIAMNDLWSIAKRRPRNNSFRDAMTGLKYCVRSRDDMETCVISTEGEGAGTVLKMNME